MKRSTKGELTSGGLRRSSVVSFKDFLDRNVVTDITTEGRDRVVRDISKLSLEDIRLGRSSFMGNILDKLEGDSLKGVYILEPSDGSTLAMAFIGIMGDEFICVNSLGEICFVGGSYLYSLKSIMPLDHINHLTKAYNTFQDLVIKSSQGYVSDEVDLDRSYRYFMQVLRDTLHYDIDVRCV